MIKKNGELDLPPPERTRRRKRPSSKKAIGRATTYANQQGTTVFASAGNDEIDFDHWITTSSTAVDGAARPHDLGDGSDRVGKGPGCSVLGRLVRPPGELLELREVRNVEFAAPGGDASYPGNEDLTRSASII